MIDSIDELDLSDVLNDLNDIYPSLTQSQESLYYSLSKLNESFIDCSNDLSIAHLNVRSLYPKIDEFAALLDSIDIKFDCICVSETWLDYSSLQLCNVNGYMTYHVVRDDGRRGGGVSVLVNERIKSKLIDNLRISNESIECLFVFCSVSGTNFIVGVVYRPPNANSDIFHDNLVDILSCLSEQKCKNVFIAGDFNYNLLNMMNDGSCVNFVNTMFLNYYIPLITKPTRVTDNCFSLIDNLFSFGSHNFTAGIFPCALSDHYLIFSVFHEFFTACTASSELVKYRVHSEISLSKLHNFLSNYNFTDILLCEDVDSGILMLNQLLMSSYDKFCPIITKTISYKRLSKPWIDAELRVKIRKRHNLLILLRLGKTDRNAYNRYRNMVTSEIRVKRKNYYNQVFETFRGDMIKTWSLINRVLKPQSTSRNSKITSLVEDGTSYSDPLYIANKFNEYFCSIGEQINSHFSINDIPNSNSITSNSVHSFFFSPASSEDVTRAIKSLKNKPCNVNSLPVFVLKYLGNICLQC